jgi:hypothetical protein
MRQFGEDVMQGKSLDDAFRDGCQQAFDAGRGDRKSKQEQYVIHNKTGNRYIVVDELIDATNERNGTVCVLYKNEEGRMFVIEKEEFWMRFTAERDENV